VYEEKDITRVSETEILIDDIESDEDYASESFDLADIYRALASSRESTPGSRRILEA
jgi:hypothetical protein